jgi:hypothetical protein
VEDSDSMKTAANHGNPMEISRPDNSEGKTKE